MFRLADYLKVPLSQIENMDWHEYQDWFAFLKIKQEEVESQK